MAKPIDTTDTTEPKRRIPFLVKEWITFFLFLGFVYGGAFMFLSDPPPDFAERARRVAGCVLHMENAVPVELTERQHTALVNHCQVLLSRSLDW